MTPICLITPTSPFLMDERVFASLGILRVAACLERDGYAVEHLDLSGIENFEDAARDHASRSGAAIFGLTATTPQMPSAAKIVAALRETRPDARIILGGPHVTLVNAARKREAKKGIVGRAHRAFDVLAAMFDVLVAGDGDDAVFHAIMPDAPKLVDADDAASALFLTNERYDELPWPARHLIDLQSYHYSIEGVKSCSLIAQLGCPFACGFCGGRQSAMLRRIRTRSTENIVGEMVKLHREHGYNGFMCYDSLTEVLTKDRGFVRFPDLQEGEEIAILDPATDELRYEAPIRLFQMPYDGDLVTVNGRALDLAITPEHRMWVKVGRGKFGHVTAAEMVAADRPTAFQQTANWRGEPYSCFHISAYVAKYLGRNQGSPKVQEGERCFEASVFVRFMAWYLAEGSSYRPKVRNGRGYRICIKQHVETNPENVAEIREILDQMGYRYSYSSNQFHIDSRELYEYLHPFGTARLKHVPDMFKKMSGELILLFLKTYLKGDGHTSAQGQEYICSHSDRMLGDLQEMAIKAGYWASCDSRHRLLLRRQRATILNENHDSFGTTPYSGHVYCVTVSTGVILVRRNGKAVWCGNCYDDELNVSRTMVELMHAIADAQRSLGVEWRLRGFIKSQLFTDQQAEAMYRAGFRWILVGFESGSPRILENINKKATREENSRCMDIARRHGLKVKALMSIGHPGESADTIMETRDWLLQEKPDDFDLTVITTYPGTPYYDEAVETLPRTWTYTAKNGDLLHSWEVDFNHDLAYYKGTPGEYTSYVYTDYLTPEQIVALRDEVEAEVRATLGIPFNHGAPGVRYEASMGQLPGHVLRRSRELICA